MHCKHCYDKWMEQRNRLHTESSRGKTPRIKLHDCITKLKRAIAGMVEHMSVSIEKKKKHTNLNWFLIWLLVKQFIWLVFLENNSSLVRFDFQDWKTEITKQSYSAIHIQCCIVFEQAIYTPVIETTLHFLNCPSSSLRGPEAVEIKTLENPHL